MAGSRRAGGAVSDGDPDFPRRVAIVGLGLIGGSLARDLSARGIRVLGHDRDAAAVRGAIESGVVHAALADDFRGIEKADCVIFAVPVDAAPALLAAAAPHLKKARLITDVGSTKRAIIDAARALALAPRFVGSHPLAGDHRSGWDASRAGLFAGSRVFLCASPETEDSALADAHALWALCGAMTEIVSAEAHDRRLAWTSHLPQLMATALALALDGAKVGAGELGPGGRDTTRLAGSSAEMWTGIALQNAEALAEALRAVEGELAAMREALERGDRPAVEQCFARGAAWWQRESLR